MATLDAASVDAIVSDPPYGLSFMGKGWDHGVPGVEFWTEALRVAKPGAHLLAFGGTRTYHRLACAIEDAGWEIRDCVMWVYGSGFPKSHDVSKAIDKMDAVDEQKTRRYRFTAWVRSTGVTARQIDAATETRMGSHYTTHSTQPAIMTREHLEQCRHLLGDVPEWVEREADIRSVESRNMAERQVYERYETGIGGVTMNNGAGQWRGEITKSHAHTDAARQWSGWGTALKPAWEPIIVARKPLVGTVAENVLRHGTGGINVDGCRIGTTKNIPASPPKARKSGSMSGPMPAGRSTDNGHNPNIGRWPANLIHDGSEEVVGLFPANRPGFSGGGTNGAGFRSEYVNGEKHGKTIPAATFGDSGSAARFFYCAKASKADRDEGCEGLPQTIKQSVAHGNKRHGTLPYINEPREMKPRPRGNHHPTVKPTALMRYLCRLVTPPGGIVLDPFTGSGSTGKGAVLEGFRFIGIEREAEYVEIAKARIAAVEAGPGPLFEAG
jgi:DNA modification methylase